MTVGPHVKEMKGHHWRAQVEQAEADLVKQFLKKDDCNAKRRDKMEPY